MPDYYPLIRAARYFGVAPWELSERSIAWTDAALVLEGAELGARGEEIKKATAKAKKARATRRRHR